MIGRIGGIAAPFIILLENNPRRALKILSIKIKFYISYDNRPKILSEKSVSFLPYTIFGVSGVLSGLWTFFLPETKGEPMNQTIEELVENIEGLRQPANCTLCVTYLVYIK